MSLNKLHPRLQDFVKNNWKDLTDIQKKAFTPIFEGKNCIIEAPTSGGKTEAVLFPLLTRIDISKSQGFKVLYIAPLKALLNNLSLRVIPYAKMCYKEAFKWHGDVSQGEKLEQMQFPSDILLTTPESIEAILLRRNNWQSVFGNLETIVIDEAHYFALTERGSHLVCLMERIAAGINRQPQRIAISATVGNPDEMLKWLNGQDSKGETIRIENKNPKRKDFQILHFNEGVGLNEHLYNLLTNKKSIVFIRSRTGTEEMATSINNINEKNGPRIPVKVRTHHSSVSKRLREDAEKAIDQASESSLNAIINTSTLELGIDIGHLDQVIQIEGLNSSGSFLQRVGRTGRRGDNPQFFRGLCTDEQQLILLTGCVSLGLKHISESILFPSKSFHILAHQTICLCLQNRGTTADQIWETLSRASCFSKISRCEFDLLISNMIQNEYLRLDRGIMLLTSDKTEKEFLRANWKRLFAIFDTGPMYNVVDGKKIIGTLDSDFARSQKLPFIFVLGGLEWNTKNIDDELQQVQVEQNKTGIAPKWNAIGSYDIPFELAQEIGRLLMNDESLQFLHPTALRIFQIERNTYRGLQWQTDKWILDYSSDDSTIHLWNFVGEKINRALRFLFHALLDFEPGYDYQKMTFRLPKELHKSPEEIFQMIAELKTLDAADYENIANNRIKPSWFSKFSDCLPEELTKKTISDKGMNWQGLERELKKVEIVFLS